MTTTYERDLLILRAIADPECVWWNERVAPFLTEGAGADGCSDWTGRTVTGYAAANLPRPYFAERNETRNVQVHRVVLVGTLGRPLGEGMIAGHMCHDLAWERGKCAGGECAHRRCTRADHLIEMPRAQNAVSAGGVGGLYARRLMCACGSALVERSDGRRWCPDCARQRRKDRWKLISDASRVLGITPKEYQQRWGNTVSEARKVLGLV